MGLTTAATLARGERIGQGAEAAYHRLVAGPGEQHLLRLDLVSAEPSPTQRRSLLHLACLTDLHLVDAQSPGRFEFADRYHGLPAADPLLPTYRPQEFLQPHAVEAMLRTVQSIEGSPLTGAPISSLICLGDQIDNGQWNELRWFLRLMQGGPLAVTSPGSAYRGVAAVSWDDPFYWHPDEYPDEYRRRWGFPSYPGALEDACLPIQARGVALPWRVCIGNHDPFIQGTAAFSPSFAALITGDRKVRAIPPDFDPASQPVGPQAGLDLLDLFVRQPEVFLTGLAVPIRPDPDRRPFGRREWIAAFLQAGGAPPGHGFSRHHLDSGETYYVDDYSPLVRLIVLDTVNPGADYMGSVGTRQLAWLEERLAEVHDRYFDASGRQVRTGCVDRLVVVCSHHGRDSLINDRVGGDGDEDLPRRLGPDVEAVLHRFPNVALWLNGHTHHNTVRPRPDPSGRTAGYWEVTTSSLLDWPCQARLVELIANGNGTLSILCTIIDHQAPADPRQAEGLPRLAAIHRELAANDPYAGMRSARHGRPSDRNVELLLPAPFALE